MHIELKGGNFAKCEHCLNTNRPIFIKNKSVFSRKTDHIYEQIYYEELAPMVMEAEKSGS